MNKRAMIAAALVLLGACGLLFAVLGPEDDLLQDVPRDPPVTPRDGGDPAEPAPSDPPSDPPPVLPPLTPEPSPSADPLPPPPTGDSAHRGRVVDPDGRGIPGAEVFAADPMGRPGLPLARSDEDGAFTCKKVDLLFLRAEGFASHVATTEEETITLARAQRVEGMVLAEETEQPLEGAEVFGESETWREVVTTDAAGRFVLDAPPGPASLRVTFPERVTRVVEVQPQLTVSLPQGVGLSGRLVDAQGAPVGPAEVWALGANQLLRPMATRAGADGRFRLHGGLDADEEVAVFAMAGALATPVDPRWQAPKDELTVVLRPLGSLILEGVPEGAAPELWPIGIDLEGFRAVGRAEGRSVVFGDLAAGSYQLTDRGEALGRTLRVRSGESRRMDYPSQAGPPPTTTLLVRAVDPLHYSTPSDCGHLKVF